MKKALNTYCSLLIMSCVLLLMKDFQEAFMWSYNLGKGTADIDLSKNWEVLNIVLWGVQNNVVVLAGVLIILITVRINKSIVFDWKNVKMFRWTGIILAAYFVISTVRNAIGMFFIQHVSGNPVNYQALVATLFVLMITEIFAIGLRLKEDNELTI